MPTADRVIAYREKNKCSVSEATKAINQMELMNQVQSATTLEDLNQALLRMIRIMK